ncbi:beta-propeller domain-containing protein [Plantactinospora sonchi]|uniref:Beta-propeller domain-containing protein n=1 Tax=Plantactinospora sonchi TaxID=1544735 RepID=A0ABU7RPF3_9ACTN
MTADRARRSRTAGTALSAGLALLTGTLLTGCTTEPDPVATPPRDPGVPAAGGMRLVSFSSCADALAGLRTAAGASVGPYGFQNGRARTFGGPEVATDTAGGGERAADAGSRQAEPAGPGHSGTNTHEAGVDEPDLVKTDGRRIVTVSRGVLRVVEPTSRRVTGSLELDPGADRDGWPEANLLLHGDRALVLVRQYGIALPDPGVRRGGAEMPPIDENAVVGPRLILVDLAGAPKVLGEYRFDGDLVDARQVGSTVRVVARSGPRLTFPLNKGPKPVDERKNLATNRRIVEQAEIGAWLPRYQTIVDGRVTTGRVDCERLSRPAVYSGTSLVSLLSFDLGADRIGDGDPVTVAADGDAVYSNGSRLYIAADQRWRALPTRADGTAATPDPKDEQTEIYQFDIAGPGRPRYVTAAAVPGWLVNQYAMSEWDGHLRVATTTGESWGENPKSSSAVYVLRADGSTLTETGRVTGLGKGERIYSVRFVQGTGYVVTFRQTDPLYTVDLRDPRAPRVTGELKITGYSAYLHPLGDGRLIGIGQEADTQGRTQGTQISLFDVSDLTRPTRIAQHHVRYGHSEAEFDPHAFLYWPDDGTLVVPLTTYQPQGGAPGGGAMVLRVGANSLTEAGLVDHAGSATPETGSIRRSLVVGNVLWTVSDTALQATDLTTLGTLGVVRL